MSGKAPQFIRRGCAILFITLLGLLTLLGSGGAGSDFDFSPSGNPDCTGIFDVVNAFGFPPVDNAPLDTPIISATARIQGFCSTKEIWITGGGEYSIDGAPFTSQAGEIRPNSDLRVRLQSAPTFGTHRSTIVSIGDHLFDPSATFSVITRDGNPADAPTAMITSPPDQEVVNADTILVIGQADDPDGIASIRVNGVDASTVNGYLNWWAEIPLVSGPNIITVASADIYLNENPTAAQIQIDNLAVILAEPLDLAVDAGNSRLLVVDGELRGLVEVDIATGDTNLLSGEDTPDNQVPLVEPSRIAVNAAGNTAWIIDYAYQDPIEVDLLTGTRTLLVDTVFPDPAESLQDAREIVVDEITGQLLLLVGSLNSAVNDTRVIAANLTDGSRQILSDASTPNADNPFRSTFLANSQVFDAGNFRLLVAQDTNLLAVDPLTGNRTEFSPTGVEGAVDATLDLANNQAIILNRVSAWLYGADLGSGDLQFLWRIPGTMNPQRVAFEPLGNRTLILFLRQRNIYALDMATGELTVAY
jgi:hypothetical protein